ncbi:MAG: hypothetical protein HQL50_10655, partial [Magnetococcales bacterium]|nr:hypothetical protein [Magnetococcales bacterium]
MRQSPSTPSTHPAPQTAAPCQRHAWWKPLCRTLLLGALCLPLTLSTAQADGHAAVSSSEGERIPLNQLFNQLPDRQDSALYEEIKEDLSNDSGAWNLLKSRTITFLTPAEALHMALQKNLTLHRTHLNTEIVTDALEEARAAFDPVFTMAFGRSESLTYGRNRIADLFYRSFQAMAPNYYLDISTNSSNP